MRVSIDWLKGILDYKSSPLELENGLTSLGLECVYKEEGPSFSGIIVGKVISVKKIENSDYLNLCIVNLGNKNKEIVCGAKNIKSGILVPVAVLGATLDDGNFKIKKVKIRGVTSNGMICSEKELGISNNHDGIMVLDSNDYELGEEFGSSIKKNKFLDIDLTPNRGDCFSHLGVAREISILENIKLKEEKVTSKFLDEKTNIKVSIEDEKACSRYACRVVKNVKVSESPPWLKDKLQAIGQKSINNIVDAANYTLFHLGHPMHTFDLDKISNSKITIKKTTKEQSVKCLDGVDRDIKKEHLLICDEKKPIAIAGIMGLENSSVTAETENILIESAYFDPVTIRRGAKILDLSTDASKRFERDTDIDAIIYSLNFLSKLIQEVSGGEVCNELIDEYPNEKLKSIVQFDLDECNSLLGTSIEEVDAINILEKLSIDIENTNNQILCTIPSYRNDLERPVDLYEEIARVYGYDNIDVTDTFTCSYSTILDDSNHINKYLSRILSTNGFNEHYSNSLYSDKENLLFSKKMDVEISNPLSSDMKYLRNSIIPGLLNAVSFNINHGNKNFKLFEMGAIHKNIIDKKEKKYIQENSLGISWCSLVKKDWKNSGILDLFDIKGEIVSIFKLLGLPISFNEKNGVLEIFSSNKKIGHLLFGESIALKALKSNTNAYFAEINVDTISKIYNENLKKDTIELPSPYPTVERDISILISKDIEYQDISASITSSAGSLLKEISLFDLYVDKKISKDKHSLSISLLFSSKGRTLKDDEIDEVMNRILKELKNEFKITQR